MAKWTGAVIAATLLMAACGAEVVEDDRNAALPAAPVVTQIALREEGACAVKSNGELWCWGTGNTYGNGDGTTLPMPIPNPIVIGNYLQVASPASGRGLHNCAVVSNGDVFCWGYNFGGQTGQQLENLTQSPTKVPNMGGPARQVVVGIHSTCALMVDATVKCWGRYSDGFIGSAPPVNTTRTGPRLVPNLQGVTKLSADRAHVCALLSNGTVKCWGENGDGQLGNRSTVDSVTPVDVFNLGQATDIAAGRMTTCAVLTNGQVKCWGSNRSYGMGFTMLANSVFNAPDQPVALARAAVAVSVGGDVHCALLDDASVSCWGHYPATNNLWYVPFAMGGMTNIAAISTGSWNELCGVTYAGGVKCMGTNSGLLQGVDIPRDQTQSQPGFVQGLGEPGAVVDATTTTVQQSTSTAPGAQVTTSTAAPQTTTTQVAGANGQPTTASDEIARTEEVVAGPLPGTPEMPPTSSPAAAEPVSPAPAGAKTVLTLKVKKSLSAALLARHGRLAVPKGAKVTVTVPTTKKMCSVTSNKLTGTKAGACRVRVTVTPKSGKSRSATVAITIVK